MRTQQGDTRDAGLIPGLGRSLRRKWQSTPVFLPGESHGQRSLCFSHSVVPNSATPWTVAHQAPLSTGFSRQEYWNGLPFPSPGNLPDLGIKPMSLVSPELSGRLFTIWANREAPYNLKNWLKIPLLALLLEFSEITANKYLHAPCFQWLLVFTSIFSSHFSNIYCT